MEIPMKSEISGNTGHGIQLTTVKIHSASGIDKKPNDIIFRCKLCNKKYRLSRNFAGIEAECFKCKKTIVVPRHSDTSDESLQDKIIFRCHECSQKYRLPRIYANQKAKCSRCHSFFIIPEQSEITQPLPVQGKISESGNGKNQNQSAEKLLSPQASITAPASPVPANNPMNMPFKDVKVENNREDIVLRNSRTQTCVEITGESLTLVKYVLAPPDRNMFKIPYCWIQQIFSKQQH